MTSGTTATNNYLTMPSSGEVLGYSLTSGSTTTTTVPIHDVIGSTIGLVNSSGSLATQYTYEPFGHPIESGSSGSAFPYLFAGMEYDFDTVLYHTPARYYNPRSGRFVSEDPLGFAGGDFNLFAYAGNDPVNLSDPTGLQAGLGGIGAADAAATTGSGPGHVGTLADYIKASSRPSADDPSGGAQDAPGSVTVGGSLGGGGVGGGVGGAPAIVVAQNDKRSVTTTDVAVAGSSVVLDAIGAPELGIAVEVAYQALRKSGVGHYAGYSIAARSPARDFTPAVTSSRFFGPALG